MKKINISNLLLFLLSVSLPFIASKLLASIWVIDSIIGIAVVAMAYNFMVNREDKRKKMCKNIKNLYKMHIDVEKKIKFVEDKIDLNTKINKLELRMKQQERKG